MIEALNGYRARDRRAALSLACLCAVTGGLVAAAALGHGVVYWLAEIGLGLAIWSWFAVLHSAGHQAYFRTRWLNTAAGHLASVFCGVPFYSWRYHHGLHHKWTGWKENDPSTDEAPDQPPSPGMVRFLEVCWRLWIPIFSLVHIVTNPWNPWRMARVVKDPVRFRRCVASQLFLAAVYAGLAIGLGSTFAAIAVPALGVFLLWADPVLLSQHAGLPVHSTGGQPVKPFPDHEPMTRSFTTTPLIDRFVLLNFNLHSVHHAYPYVPHYDLHKVRYAARHDVPLVSWVARWKAAGIRALLWGG